MDAEQRAHYDAHGYLHLRGVLEPAHLQRLNAVYDERLQAEILSSSESSEQGGGWAPRRRANFDTQSQRYTHLRQFWDTSYAELIGHPAIVPIVRELMCDEEWGASVSWCLGASSS